MRSRALEVAICDAWFLGIPVAPLAPAGVVAVCCHAVPRAQALGSMEGTMIGRVCVQGELLLICFGPGAPSSRLLAERLSRLQSPALLRCTWQLTLVAANSPPGSQLRDVSEG